MKPKIKHKVILILAAGILISVSSPAEARAPKVSEKVKLYQIALQEPKKYALLKMADYGWYKTQHVCLTNLWTKESNWNYKSDNPISSAFGIAQMLNEKSKNPVTQINNGLRYIMHRYDNPCNAWKYWLSHKWY